MCKSKQYLQLKCLKKHFSHYDILFKDGFEVRLCILMFLKIPLVSCLNSWYNMIISQSLKHK